MGPDRIPLNNVPVRRRPTPEPVQVSGEDFFGGLRSVDVVHVRGIVRYLESQNGYLEGVSLGVIAIGDAAVRPKNRKQFPDGIDLQVHTSSASEAEQNGRDRLVASSKIIEGLLEYSTEHDFTAVRGEDERAGADRLVVLTPSEGLPIRVFVVHPFMYPNYPRYLKGRQMFGENEGAFAVLV